jgi:hypothetical protein
MPDLVETREAPQTQSMFLPTDIEENQTFPLASVAKADTAEATPVHEETGGQILQQKQLSLAKKEAGGVRHPLHRDFCLRS